MLPINSRDAAKTRLGLALDPEERDVLVLGMFANTVRVLAGWPSCRRIHVVTSDYAVADVVARGFGSVVTVSDPGSGLNDALRAGRDAAVAAGATAVLMLPADLPLLTSASLDVLLAAADAAIAAGSGRPVVVIAPADARNGTNALLLVAAVDHRAAVRAVQLRGAPARSAAVVASVQVVDDALIGFDLDTPTISTDSTSASACELEELGDEIERELVFTLAAVPTILAVPLPGIPEIQPGDDLPALIADAWRLLAADDAVLAPRAGDVLVVTQKIVSKAEGCVIDLTTIDPRPQAVVRASWDRDARQVEVVLRESAEIVRMDRGLIISRTKHGFVCANAGVDASNTGRRRSVTLLPDRSGCLRARDPRPTPRAAEHPARPCAGHRVRLIRSAVALRNRRCRPGRCRHRAAHRPARHP